MKTIYGYIGILIAVCLLQACESDLDKPIIATDRLSLLYWRLYRKRIPSTRCNKMKLH